jgi:hypothetical protein
MAKPLGLSNLKLGQQVCKTQWPAQSLSRINLNFNGQVWIPLSYKNSMANSAIELYALDGPLGHWVAQSLMAWLLSCTNLVAGLAIKFVHTGQRPSQLYNSMDYGCVSDGVIKLKEWLSWPSICKDQGPPLPLKLCNWMPGRPGWGCLWMSLRGVSCRTKLAPAVGIAE